MRFFTNKENVLESTPLEEVFTGNYGFQKALKAKARDKLIDAAQVLVLLLIRVFSYYKNTTNIRVCVATVTIRYYILYNSCLSL